VRIGAGKTTQVGAFALPALVTKNDMVAGCACAGAIMPKLHATVAPITHANCIRIESSPLRATRLPCRRADWYRPFL